MDNRYSGPRVEPKNSKIVELELVELVEPKNVKTKNAKIVEDCLAV